MAFINAFGMNMMRVEHHQLVNARCDTKQVDAGYNSALRSMFRKFVWIVGLLQVVRSERLCLSST